MGDSHLKFAYADPPYLGCGAKLYGFPEWDSIERHAELIAVMCRDFPDGWVYSLSSPSVFDLAHIFPKGRRLGAWTKPFASFKPNVNPAYAWEPVVFFGGRKRDRLDDTARDWHSENIAMMKGLPGAKPPKFGGFIEGLLGARAADTIVDLFPGTCGLHGISQWERADPSVHKLHIREAK